MQEVIDWLKTKEGQNWTQNTIRPASRYEFFTDRRGAFAEIEPISELGNLDHAYRPFSEKRLRAGLLCIDDDGNLPLLYEPETLPPGLSCPA